MPRSLLSNVHKLLLSIYVLSVCWVCVCVWKWLEYVRFHESAWKYATLIATAAYRAIWARNSAAWFTEHSLACSNINTNTYKYIIKYVYIHSHSYAASLHFHSTTPHAYSFNTSLTACWAVIAMYCQQLNNNNKAIK